MTGLFNGNRLPGAGWQVSASEGLFDFQRNALWVTASMGFRSIQDMTMVIIQGLGTQDARLIKDDEGVIKTGFPADPRKELGDHITNSYLWVLGLYEIVRTISQHAKNGSSPLHAYSADIDGLKHNINRLRVPLAKLEASSKNPTDSPIAYPGINMQHGISWSLGADASGQEIWISRRELSDQALGLFTKISKAVNV
ncbi:hypothetical protein [Serratia fonticola]|uniref:hypothetical protein n=1 Tax=Serratia fonticola TaxID=47917 RepID=UPI0024DE69B1|nr:hypothetical protein [Serratia fonticola]MDK2377303.1 hypothetical protein [Serratia fonticola]